MNKQNIPMRTEHSKLGLEYMVAYINGITQVDKMRLIEIGSYAGDSTEIFCKQFKTVIAIDPWKSNIGGITDSVDMSMIQLAFNQRINRFKNCKVIQDFSYNACIKIKKHSADILYVDGAHDYISVKYDLINFKDKIKPGGWITGHDYCKKFPGVMKAVIEILGEPDKIFQDTSWIKRV